MSTFESLILNQNELLNYIEFLRIELINIGLLYGFQNEQTIEISQKLDYFIVEYQKLAEETTV